MFCFETTLPISIILQPRQKTSPSNVQLVPLLRTRITSGVWYVQHVKINTIWDQIVLCEPRFPYVFYVTNTTWKDWPIKKIDVGIREIGIDKTFSVSNITS